jgi:hypothetical protein
MPAFFEAIAGIVAGERGRAVSYKGAVTPNDGSVRFSIDFASRAIDVALTRMGSADMARADMARADMARDIPALDAAHRQRRAV